MFMFRFCGAKYLPVASFSFERNNYLPTKIYMYKHSNIESLSNFILTSGIELTLASSVGARSGLVNSGFRPKFIQLKLILGWFHFWGGTEINFVIL